MPDLLVTLLLIAAILLVADLLLAGGGMTMSGMSAMAGAVGHPLAAGALVVLVIGLVLALVGLAIAMLGHSVRAALDPGGHQIVEVVVDRGYRPETIQARAWVPLRIVFRRLDDDACSERVVFSSPRLDRRLQPRGATTVDLPAQPAGEIRFTCGMGRYRGRIDLVDEPDRSLLARLRDRTSRLEKPLGTALVLWICSLPLIALLAVLALDATAAVAAASAVLVALVLGCLWAFRSPPHQRRSD